MCGYFSFCCLDISGATPSYCGEFQGAGTLEQGLQSINCKGRCSCFSVKLFTI